GFTISSDCATGSTTCTVNNNNNAGNVTLGLNGNDLIGTVTVGSQGGSVTYGTGGSVTFTVTVNRGTSAGSFNANLTTAAVPSGATTSFSPNPVVFTASDISKTSTLTITTAATTLAATGTSFTVTATNAGGAGDSGSGNGSLTVGKRPITVTAASNTKIYDG